MQRLSSLQKLAANMQLWESQSKKRDGYPRGRRPKPRVDAPLRNTYPIFDIPPLLLDLDAEGASGVRAFDSHIDGVPEPNHAPRERELRPMAERVASWEAGYQKRVDWSTPLRQNKFHRFQISDFDLIAASLLESPNAPEPAADSADAPRSYLRMLSTTLRRNGIPLTVRHDPEVMIKYMLRCRRPPHKKLPKYKDEALYLQALGECQTLPEIERAVANMTTNLEGCRILSNTSDELCTSLASASRATPTQLLPLLNNLFINLDRHGLPVSTKLYDLGIWASLKCQAIITAHQYIRRKLERGDHCDSTIDDILNQVLQTSIAPSSSKSHQFQSNDSSRLEMIFSLLTGYVPGEEQLTVSLRSLISPEKPDSFRLYIRCLAHLGAFRTIWHERHGSGSGSRGIGVGTYQVSDSGENDPFASAVLHALASNKGVGALATLPEFTDATGRFREDCQLDMLAISKSANALALRGSKNGIENSVDVKRHKHLYEIFREEQIEKALPALQQFLIKTNSSP